MKQYSYETKNLIAIVNSALDGKIHTSVFTPRKLLTELREIKMHLPIGNDLSLDIQSESLTELLRISDITIFYQDDYLIFCIGIPLTSSDEYTMFHPIPLPLKYNNNTVVLIAPEVEYLGLCNDNENFFIISIR